MKKVLKRGGIILLGALGLLVLAVAYIYAVPTYRFNRVPDVQAVSDDIFSNNCQTGPDATHKERDCYAMCKPLETEVNNILSVSAVDRVKQALPAGFAPLLDLCLPFLELPEYQVLDRSSGSISPQPMSMTNQLLIGLMYSQADCPPLFVTPYREVLPVLTSTFPDPATGLALKYLVPTVFQELTFAAGPINKNPETAPRQICTFIKEYDVNVNEMTNPVSSFETMNDFFARDIDLETRPLNRDPSTISSPTDSTVIVYPTVTEAQKFWIKGKSFTLGQFLDENHADFAQRYQNPSVALFRLSVDDYHRFHAPLSGKLLKTHWVEANDFFSVQPLALQNSSISVLSQNRRVILEIENSAIGPYLMIPVGATEVGSIVLAETSVFAKGAEMGHFEFGGSLVALVFKENAVSFDEDLLQASKEAVEGRLLVGEQVGTLIPSLEK